MHFVDLRVLNMSMYIREIIAEEFVEDPLYKPRFYHNFIYPNTLFAYGNYYEGH